MKRYMFLRACKHGQIRVVAQLIGQVNIDTQDNEGTGLMLASSRGNSEIVELLIDKGANLNICNNKGQTALHLAARGFEEIVHLLVNAGADSTIRDNENKTAIDMAKEGQNFISVFLLNKALIDEQDEDGNTMVIKACSMKLPHEIIFLQKNGADMFIKNNMGSSAYDILLNQTVLHEELQALKEKLILEQVIADEMDIRCAL